MKLVNNNISPLAFYDDIALQNHRKSYAFGQVFPLITYKNYLLPFQFVLNTTNAPSVKAVYLHDFNSGASVNITNDIISNGLVIKEVNGYTLIAYPAVFSINAIDHEGFYYLQITLSDESVYYSEVFCSKNDVSDCVLLEWGNTYDLEMLKGIISFKDFVKFKCYLQTQIGRPEYTFEEQATERLGYSFIESQVSKKTYKFTALAPEYLCDALRIVRLCDTKRITQGSQVYEPTSFSVEPKWQEQGDLASVEVEFDTATVIANLGGYTTKAERKDFNESFNQDYR